jgi:hypothetical protein
LLIEEQRTNICLQSEDFATTWTTSAVSVQTNQAVAPSGELTADRLIEDSTTAEHNLRQTSITVSSSAAYTATIYAKASGRTTFRLLCSTTGPSSGFAGGSFDLSAGTATASGTATATIENVGNGWYRCRATVTSGAAQTAMEYRVQLQSGSYTGDGYSGVYIWGAQLEAGAFATSYIPTTTTALTRNADVASMTGTNFSDWYNASEGTLYVDFQWTTATPRNNSPLFRFDDGTNNNFVQLGFRNVSPTAPGAISLRLSGGTTYETTTGTVSTNDGLRHKFAGAYTASELAFSADAQTAGTATPAGVPVVNVARIGASNTGVATNYAIYIRSIRYYPVRVSDAQLQALTG